MRRVAPNARRESTAVGQARRKHGRRAGLRYRARQLTDERIEWTPAGFGEETRVRSRFAIVSLILTASFGAGCSKTGQSSQFLAAPASTLHPPESPAANSGASTSARDMELVRQAVKDHVRDDREISLSAMDMSVDSVSLSGDQAQAQVTFRALQGGPTMAMIYSLERHGDGWQVVKGQPAEGEFVHPPMDQTPGRSPIPAAPAVPDIHEFFKNHPATSSN